MPDENYQHSDLAEGGKRPTTAGRIYAGAIFAAVVGIFWFLWSISADIMAANYIFGVCGFKQEYGLPCPGCYVTTASIAFVRGRVFEAFYIQPAGALLCSVLALVGVFSLLIAVFGIKFGFLYRLKLAQVIKYVIVSGIIIFGSGWGVTLARTIAELNNP